MSIVSNRENVLRIYDDAAKNGWVIPCFCTENLTTTEAIISEASDFAKENRIDRVPVTLAITIKYPHRSQASFYTHTGDTSVGLKLFYADAKIIAEKYPNVDLLIHLDHAQHDLDEELLNSDLSIYSSVMYDASNLPLEENIMKTKAFVKRKGKELLIEGACDEIIDAGGSEHNDITSPDKCEEYVKETGVDLVVANLGTEHRASSKDLKYHGDAAQLIKERIGAKIVLHGTSSVSSNQIKKLYEDGICKVNIWTALERDSSPVLFESMVKTASRTAGPKVVERLISEGFLCNKCKTNEPTALSCFTTAARQKIVYESMKKMIRGYFDMWYVL